ncbi:putative protease with the C-terminal PDZ domain [Rhodanobacter sp. 115]|nr:putative protease with the C-terminal PDZ domain [Rhodanobacter sp. 115]
MKIPAFRSSLIAAAVIGALSLSAASFAQDASRPAPVDQPYPGTLAVKVDLTDAAKRIFRVHETIPVKSGPFTLLYPEWIPGEHAPSGPIQNVAGLIITANGKQLPWRRDLRDMFAINLDVPAGVSQLDVSFQFLSPAPGQGSLFGASASSTPNFVDVEFNQVAFYPAGHYSSQIHIQPTVELPQGWKFGTALQVESQAGNAITFKPVTFNNFVDSPLIAGTHFDRVDLAPGAKVPVHLNVVGDAANDVKLTTKQLDEQRSMVKQTGLLFGSHHYDHYDFLLTLSDHTGHFGLEHHQSSDDRLPADFFTNDDMHTLAASLMTHEYVHSWNGKFRQSGRFVDAQLQREGTGRPAVGVRGPHRLLVQRAHRALGPVDTGAIPRCHGQHGRGDERAHRSRLAFAAGHRRRRAADLLRRWRLGQLAPRHRFLSGRPVAVAGRGYQDPRTQRRQAFAG